jgi:restriction endonuclease S subunit
MNEEGNGTLIYRLNEIEDCFLSDCPSKRAPVPKSIEADYTLKDGDVLFCRTNGNINYVGRTGMFCGDGQAVFASYLVRARADTKKILPEYLTVFLNTSFGRKQIVRRAMPSNQINVSAAELQRIDIFVPEWDDQIEIAAIVRRAYSRKKDGLVSLAEAQRLLELELGLDAVHFERPMGYATTFSDLLVSHRSDAQHFQPRFAHLMAHISKFPTRRIRDIRRLNRRGIQPIYVKEGTHAVVNSQHLGPKHINYDGLERTTEKLFNAAPEAHIRKDDLLIYTTGAYIGRTNVYLDDAPAFASNHVNILRLSPDIDHAYMAMVFQSIIGQFQTQKHARGSAQAELYPTDIDKFIVPLLPTEKQQEIGNLVRESLAQQRESARLLEQAKAGVEQLIEEAVAA